MPAIIPETPSEIAKRLDQLPSTTNKETKHAMQKTTPASAPEHPRIMRMMSGFTNSECLNLLF
ncbi:hypothetical protein [Rubinisphaera italica]|uniref:hypothetical protein n=1 Tax=Rubinisphaera italica TaxID=2527969 RepID=UPI0011B3D52D|nr:hypothetical protein [Rubinisphaera italica]